MIHTFSQVFKLQGVTPIGYYINFLQPEFNKIYEEITHQKVITPIIKRVELLPPSIQSITQNKYFITLTSSRQQVVLNNEFILSSPNFNRENYNFIDYITKHPNVRL